MRIIASVEDCKVVKKILDYLKIYEFERKKQPHKIHTCCGKRQYFSKGQVNDEFYGYSPNVEYVAFLIQSYSDINKKNNRINQYQIYLKKIKFDIIFFIIYSKQG